MGDIEKQAMAAVLKDMGAAAKKAKHGKHKRPEAEVKVTEVEGAPGLAGLMGEPGNDASSIVDENSPSSEELEQLLSQLTK